ncbi:hypothetical protein NRIC_29830 [Enterococcus florum]|uniref:Uncharacterized protein n=1 Tax=Enterococcus florum TaxID=2480627 RepID=A0A4P5PHH3_9ENTE|nr:CRISPR-associated protein Csn2-St [Enterococcus florum]GCF95092.1 hypothetical protein NRIC_29830 [Enterococcus florum]
MEIAIEYEYGKYLEFEGENLTYIFGANHEIKWKLYRGLKRFCTGKNLSELEENVYGDDGIVIKCDERHMKAKDLPMYFLDCRESFLEQYRYTKGSMMQKFIDSLENDFQLTKHLEMLNDDFLKMEIGMQNNFASTLTHVYPVIKSITYKEMVKHFLELSFSERDIVFPIDMMDITMLIDDYCTLLRTEIEKTQKKTWLWINNPNAFISKRVFSLFLKKLKKISEDTNLLHVFIMSDDYLDLHYQAEDISNTILVYETYQQLPHFHVLADSIGNYYPNDFSYSSENLITSLYRIFPYIGWDSSSGEVYLKSKDMILLKVVAQLLPCHMKIKCTDLGEKLTSLELKFLLS